MKRDRGSIARRIAFVIAVAGVSALAACHLFLDPDDLLSGNGSNEAGTSDSPNGPGPANDGGAREGSFATVVPPCVPDVPDGATLFAVLGDKPGTLPANCPANYDPSPSAVAYGDLQAEADCGVSTCNCTAEPGQCGAASIGFHPSATCSSTSSSGSTTCTTQPSTSYDYISVESKLTAQCNPSGEATAALADASFGLEIRTCKPAATAVLPACAMGLTGMPPTPNARVCYRFIDDDNNNNRNCEGRYQQVSFSKNGVIEDSRECRCTCSSNAPQSCTLTADLLEAGTGACDAGAGGGVVGTAQAGCTKVPTGVRSARLANSPTPPSFNCEARAQLQGGASSENNYNLCCLDQCDSCRYAAAAPGGACATQGKACDDDPACVAYARCADLVCRTLGAGGNGTDCQPCREKGGINDAGIELSSVAKQVALEGCLATTCIADCIEQEER